MGAGEQGGDSAQPSASNTLSRLPAVSLEALYLVAGLAAGIVAVGILSAALPPLEDNPTLSLGLGPLLMGIAALVYRYVAISADPASRKALLETKAGWLKTLALTLAAALAAVVGSMLIAWILAQIGWVVKEQSGVLKLTAPVDGEINPAVFVLAPLALLAAPLAEEWLFRAWFFRRLAQQSTLPIAYLGSAFAFAAIHGNWGGVPVYMWLGLCFAFAYAKTGRWSAAVGVHVLNNAATMALLIWGARS